MSIAGHTFWETTIGRVCQGCGMRFVHVAQAHRSDIGREGFAHQGLLIEREYDEIDAERNRIFALVAGVASGNGPET